MKKTTCLICIALLIGTIKASLKARIVGGEDAVIKDFPYLVSIRAKNKHICGGCIISDRHILTAAHCVTRQKRILTAYVPMTVVTGASSLSEIGNSHSIDRVTVHPLWYKTDETELVHDVAVLTLADRIAFDAKQQAIRLPSENSLTGESGVFVGWGRTSAAKAARLSDQLQKLTMTVLDYTDCRSQHKDMIYKGQLCAYHTGGRGPCYGDSGGPLVSDINQVVGIASWIYEGRCGVGIPEVFTNVYKYRAFIDTAMDL